MEKKSNISSGQTKMKCPNCGKDDLDLMPFRKGESRGYDCYCFECEWSGDILPDKESNYYDSSHTIDVQVAWTPGVNQALLFSKYVRTESQEKQTKRTGE